MLFSIVAAPVYISVNSAQGPLSSAASLTLVKSHLFDNSHSNRCEVVSLCGFPHCISW